MKRIVIALALTAVCLYSGNEAFTANTANQTVTFAVNAVNEISVSAGAISLTISTATAGSEPSDATNTATTYAVTTNESSKKITGALDSDMPAGVTLKVQLAAPTGGSSAGEVTLSGTAADLVTGITKKAEGAKTISYKLQTTVAAGVISSASRTVTFTLSS